MFVPPRCTTICSEKIELFERTLEDKTKMVEKLKQMLSQKKFLICFSCLVRITFPVMLATPLKTKTSRLMPFFRKRGQSERQEKGRRKVGESHLKATIRLVGSNSPQIPLLMRHIGISHKVTTLNPFNRKLLQNTTSLLSNWFSIRRIAS